MAAQQNPIARVSKKLAKKLTRRARRSEEPTPIVVRERVEVKKLVFAGDEPQGPMSLSDLDRLSLFGRFALPPLARMSLEDQGRYVDSLLSVQRMHALGLDPESFEFPEARVRLIYNEVYERTASLGAESRHVEFDGATTGELSHFLKAHAGDAVHVAAPMLTMDKTIVVPAQTSLYGHGVRLVAGPEAVEKAILLNEVTDVVVSGFHIVDCCDYPLYVKRSQRFVVEDNYIEKCRAKAICVMGENKHFVLRNNRISHTGNGALFLHGVVERGVIEQNVLDHVGGTWNFSGGIVFSALDIENIDTAYNPWKQHDLTSRVEAPHDLVITRNIIRDGASNGLYSHAGYCNYIVGNVIEHNNKEGMCLDFGTCGTYVAHNIIHANGGRFHMDAQQLKDDYIQDFGVLADGSSPAKVPGISLDNAAYNIIYQNEVSQNSGTGIKMVRASVCNVILCNEVTSNNVGQNNRFHFYGIELSTDLRPDYEPNEVRELDFAPCFENIVARNTISGTHFSGVFLGQDAYINDVFDNVIGEAGIPIECLSEKLNSIVNNMIL
ncbi:MAG: right-handed parallel beta-helix repeat-containing protein [Atopobiaceae bacterium]|jgi:hypothetical protein|nr:right-handed parallel beta-helix repeat-containing protein [Atopobiaceae bacterium]